MILLRSREDPILTTSCITHVIVLLLKVFRGAVLLTQTLPKSSPARHRLQPNSCIDEIPVSSHSQRCYENAVASSPVDHPLGKKPLAE